MNHDGHEAHEEFWVTFVFFAVFVVEWPTASPPTR